MYQDYPKLTPASQWILTEFIELQNQINYHNSNYDLAHTIDKIDDFVWNKLSKWYIEYLKSDDRDLDFSIDLFSQFNKLVSPYIPFETEVLWSEFFDQKQVLALEIYDSKWASAVCSNNVIDSEKQKFEIAIEFVEYIRSLRGLYAIDFSRSLEIMTDSSTLLNFKKFFEKIAKVEVVESIDENVYSFMIQSNKCSINLLLYIENIELEILRTNKKIEDLKLQITNINKSLNNPEFVSNAPSEAVEEKKEQLELRDADLKQQQNKLTFLQNSV
jgi:valyl-tRNA synthetase